VEFGRQANSARHCDESPADFPVGNYLVYLVPTLCVGTTVPTLRVALDREFRAKRAFASPEDSRVNSGFADFSKIDASKSV
jgi:hypothetical protein